MIQELLKIPTLSKGHVLKLHTLSFIGVKLKDVVSIYSRAEVSIEQVENLKILCQQFFNASNLLLTDITPTMWTVGVALPYHTSKLHQKLGYGLGLNSMQGREAKHVKFAKYMENTCNARKSLRWWTVFRHEFVCMVWLREQDPYSIAYRCEKRNISDSYIPKRVRDCDDRFCHCGVLKTTTANQGCEICTSDLMKGIKQTVKLLQVERSLLNSLNSIRIKFRFKALFKFGAVSKEICPLTQQFT